MAAPSWEVQASGQEGSAAGRRWAGELGAQAPPALLELRGIEVPGRSSPRLDGVSLTLAPGERVALLGPSGAGKSTLLAVANGLLAPAAGTVLWQGQPPARSRRGRRLQQARIGTLWQDLRLIEELTVQQNLNAARLAVWGWHRALLNLLLPLESPACAQALRAVDLEASLLDQPVSALSGGQRQRVAIARLLRQEPLLLLADEPLASLDPRLASELLALLLHQAVAPRGLLLSLHRPDLLAGFDRVVGLRAGRVVLDVPVAQLDAEGLRQLYADGSAGAVVPASWPESAGPGPGIGLHKASAELVSPGAASPRSEQAPRQSGIPEDDLEAIEVRQARLLGFAIASGLQDRGKALPERRQALLFELLAAEHRLYQPLRQLLALPAFELFVQAAAAGSGAAHREALLQAIGAVYPAQRLAPLAGFVDGYLAGMPSPGEANAGPGLPSP